MENFKICLSLLVLVVLSCCVSETIGHQLPGGISEIKQDKIGHVNNLVKKVINQLEQRINKRIDYFQTINYRDQIVSGTNYFVKVRLYHPDQTQSIAHLSIWEQPWTNRVELKDVQLE